MRWRGGDWIRDGESIERYGIVWEEVEAGTQGDVAGGAGGRQAATGVSPRDAGVSAAGALEHVRLDDCRGGGVRVSARAGDYGEAGAGGGDGIVSRGVDAMDCGRDEGERIWEDHLV